MNLAMTYIARSTFDRLHMSDTFSFSRQGTTENNFWEGGIYSQPATGVWLPVKKNYFG
jgi:hypothetical protein